MYLNESENGGDSTVISNRPSKESLNADDNVCDQLKPLWSGLTFFFFVTKVSFMADCQKKYFDFSSVVW